MTRVLLQAKSQKGKSRICQYGAEWEVITRSESVPCCNGAGVLLKSVNCPWYHRWLSVPEDPDFVVQQEELNAAMGVHGN